MNALLFLLSSAFVADAHIAMWHDSMFGLNWPKQATESPNYNANVQISPLRKSDNLNTDEWFGHGYKDYPPVEGAFLDLPSGGSFLAELACNRALTTMRDPRISNVPMTYYACNDTRGPLHVMNELHTTPDPTLFGGTTLAIAYTSDVKALQPSDMTVISVNYTSPWAKDTIYQIPQLGACPDGGCLCTWNWIHQGGKGEGYGAEIYNLLFRCRITGSITSSTLPVGKAAVPNLCEDSPSNCTSGPKQPIYVYQKSGNNMPDPEVDPPTYNKRYGFEDGAQNDLFGAVESLVKPSAKICRTRRKSRSRRQG